MTAPTPGERLARLKAWRDRRAAAEIADGAEAFLGKPKNWFEDPSWMCPNGHVSGNFLKCEEDGDQCLECRARVILGPPIGERALAATQWWLEAA